MLKAHEEEVAISQGTLVKEDEGQKLKSTKAGVPSSSYGDGMDSKRISVTGTSRISPKKPKPKPTLVSRFAVQ